MDFIECCRKFISLDSTPSQGNFALAKFASDLCAQKGLVVEVQEEYWGDQKQMNLIARPKNQHPNNRPGAEFMLQNHLDTVDPGPFAVWAATGHNPFDAHIIDNKIYGLGAADVKLDFLCKLEALMQFKAETAWRLPPVLVGTFGEETGMVGALKLIKKNKVNAKMALVGEPTNLQIVTSAKGIATVEIQIPFGEDEQKYRLEHNLKENTNTQSRIFNGKPSHSSTPHLGESAIVKMLEYLGQMPEDLTVVEIDGGINFNTVPSHAFLELDLVSGHKVPMAMKMNKIYKAVKELETQFQKFNDPDFSPSHPTLNIGLIRTQEDHVVLTGNARIPPVVTQDVYDLWMKDLKQVCNEVGADFRITDYKKPFRLNSNSIFVRGCLDELKSMGLSQIPISQPSTNEASLFNRAGIECLSFGPGLRDGNIHTPQEHVSVSDLNRAIEFYKKVIERFCL